VYGSTDQGGFTPPPPPPAPSSEAPPGSARHVYLLGRLRSRQITMEEATELFAIQQAMIRAAARAPTAPSTASGPTSAPTPGGAPMAGLSVMSDEGLALALLAFGTGAGVLAAILKRNRDGAATSAPPTR
jgi:hypothetical protein